MKIKVQTFWETHKIWKNLPRGFDKSADLLNKRQNLKEDFFEIMCASQKVQTFIETSLQYKPQLIHFLIDLKTAPHSSFKKWT